MNNKLAMYMASLESSTVAKEREFEIYGRLVDFDQLIKCDSFEGHSQWGVYVDHPSGREGVIRVRSIDDRVYIQTIKIKGGTEGDDEVEIEVDVNVFNTLKSLTTQGLIKNRYKFIMTDELTYEVDVFLKEDGSFSEWVKIDIEIPSEGSIDEWLAKLPDLPIDITEERVIRPGKKSKEDGKWVGALFDKEFTIKNIK